MMGEIVNVNDVQVSFWDLPAVWGKGSKEIAAALMDLKTEDGLLILDRDYALEKPVEFFAEIIEHLTMKFGPPKNPMILAQEFKRKT